MTDEDVVATKKLVMEAFIFWRQILDLDRVHFNIEWIRGTRAEEPESAAFIDARWEYLQATVYFYLPIIQRNEGEDLDNIIVHELSHLLVAPAQPPGFCEPQVEYAVECVARAIQRAYKQGEADAKTQELRTG